MTPRHVVDGRLIGNPMRRSALASYLQHSPNPDDTLAMMRHRRSRESSEESRDSYHDTICWMFQECQSVLAHSRQDESRKA